MNKRHLHHVWRHIRLLKPWYFVVLAMLSGLIFIAAMRNNYQHMTVLRQAVYDADKNGGDTGAALQELRNYVYAHMNTNLATKDGVYPPIQLKYTYDRLVQASGSQTAADNASIYSAAQAYCEGQNSADFSGRNRVPCIEQYVTEHTINKSQTIPDSLYKFSFASPRWSPDLAGWSLIVSLLSFLIAGVLYAIRRWVNS